MTNRELSRKPRRIRDRLRHGTNPERDLAMLEEIGYKPVSEWDNEELARGRPRNKRGTFAGPSPSWLSEAIQAEARKRLKERTFSAVMAHSEAVMKVLVDLATDPATPAGVRADIGKFIYEQLHGKAKAHVDVGAQAAPRVAIAAAIVLDDGLPQDTPAVLDGEYIEDDEDS
ncbi:hypothetical protein [Micromonospora haikouensis]|uniref:Uncharacterized protein n=1 Tax=Micromonospora haikouensis TaxID=686309 RepID=A0A0D0VVF3_9ACTN|nr:hypothetical protein [Micromonospora haikouensis]KIR64738.1 hypothetical protein TK50_03715 [Micromonospora haikouensis]